MNVDSHQCPLSHCCLARMLPCGIGATLVPWFTSLKFWQISHFALFVVILVHTVVGLVPIDLASKCRCTPFSIASLFTRMCNSGHDSPLLLCAFCASVIGEQAFTFAFSNWNTWSISRVDAPVCTIVGLVFSSSLCMTMGPQLCPFNVIVLLTYSCITPKVCSIGLPNKKSHLPSYGMTLNVPNHGMLSMSNVPCHVANDGASVPSAMCMRLVGNDHPDTM